MVNIVKAPDLYTKLYYPIKSKIIIVFLMIYSKQHEIFFSLRVLVKTT